ncbi:unnamed protein product, partial [Staurois parvus]
MFSSQEMRRSSICLAAASNAHYAPGTFFIGFFFEFGQGHRGPMIPYCPGAP